MNYFVLKRNPDLSGVGRKKSNDHRHWYVQTKINGAPAGSKANEGDIVYLYEVDYAVWGKGRIVKKSPPVVLTKIDDILDFSTGHGGVVTNFPNAEFWGRRLLLDVWKKWKEEGKFSWHIQEFCLDQEILRVPVALAKKYGGQASMQLMSGPLETEAVPLELKPEIPLTLRIKLYQEFNLIGDEPYYDIDHFIPKSLLGPGNIEENLIPIGSSINRKKSNSVPSGIFEIALKFDIDKRLSLPLSAYKYPTSPAFLGDNDSKDKAKLIVGEVNKLSLTEAREFFYQVRKIHHPNFEFRGA